MKAGTLKFNGTDLALYGQPRFTLRKTPEPAAPAVATHRRVQVAVTVDLHAGMPATVWARARKLAEILAAAREGVLEIHSENGATVSWLATPGENSLPEAIAAGRGRVEMSFTAIEPVAGADYPLALEIDPLDGEDPVTLHRPTSWSETVRPVRPDGRSPVRAEIGSTLTFAARTAYADAGDSLAARAETLQTEAARIRALAGAECLLSFAGFERVVQMESVSATPSEGWEYLEVQAQARYVTLPGDTLAEVQYEVDREEDPATGETRISLSGGIEASDQATAEAKVDALVAAWRTASRRVLAIKKTDTYLDGEDAGDFPVWTGLRFEIRLAEGSGETRYTLKIDTREGVEGRRVTYSGTATAADLETLLATIATAAAGKHPVEIRSEIGVEYVTDDEGAPKLASGTFTYEYAVASAYLRGTITRAYSKGLLGEWTATVSGSVTTTSLAHAVTVARGHIPGGVILRTDDERDAGAFYGVAPNGSDKAEQWSTLEFSYAWGTDHTSTAISYTDSSAPDYTRMVEQRTIAGTCHAVNAATARAQVAALLAGLSLSNPVSSTLTDSHERAGTSPGHLDRWLSLQFSHIFEVAITGEVGHDIIEAQWSIERTGMVDHEPMTEVPLSTPVKQVPFGYNIGMLSASGSVKARQQATARAWGQSKQAAVAAYGGTAGAQDPPKERMAATLVPMSGTTVATYQFDFTYSYRYAAGLTGLWPAGLTL